MAATLSPDSAQGYDAKFLEEDKGKTLLIVEWVLVVVSAAFLSLRVFAKISRGRRMWYDDHILIASWVGSRTAPIFPSLL